MELDYLPIDRNRIQFQPDRFATSIDGKQLIFRISWNPVAEQFFTDIFDIEGVTIVEGRVITYGTDIIENVMDERLPDVMIVPADPAGEFTEITFDNFMREVKPWIVGGN